MNLEDVLPVLISDIGYDLEYLFEDSIPEIYYCLKEFNKAIGLLRIDLDTSSISIMTGRHDLYKTINLINPDSILQIKKTIEEYKMYFDVGEVLKDLCEIL